ncbi:HAMP domain-containing histidine kinase [Myxococcota bacterium]|nr:HAMP domain-containing histidine kinase [Myxococcota bacterium]
MRRPDEDPSIEGVVTPEFRVIHHLFHDFKGGLATIVMCLDAVREGMVGEVSPAQQRWLEKAERNCQHLATLIDDFRDLSRIQDGCFATEREVMEPAAMLATLSQEVAAEASRRQIQVVFEVPDRLPGTCEASPLVARVLHRAYGVLVDCTRTRGRLESRIVVEQASPHCWLRVEAKSEGVEMEVAALDSVFDLMDQTVRGLQLGRGYTLLFCRAAARFLSGDLSLRPWPGRGTCLDLRLPLGLPGEP